MTLLQISAGKRILKINQHLEKLQTKVQWLGFFGLIV